MMRQFLAAASRVVEYRRWVVCWGHCCESLIFAFEPLRAHRPIGRSLKIRFTQNSCVASQTFIYRGLSVMRPRENR